MILNDLLANIKTTQILGSTDIDITGIQFDSRKVGEGNLFVAQDGTTVDGHNFITDCVAKGAKAVLLSKKEFLPSQPDGVTYILTNDADEALGQMASKWFGEPSKKLTLVGVTGTNGKTTIATLLYKLTRASGHKAGELNALLAKMVAAGCSHAFMEVSSHSIAQRRIAGLDFDGALFTNLTRDHIDYHKTFDNYRDTKKRLFDDLKPAAFAVTNKDDKNGLVMTQNCKAAVYTYSTRAMADYRAQILEEGFDGMLLQLDGQEVFVPLVGRFNVSNLLCIYGAAINLGFDKMEVLRVLSTLTPVNGRFETIRSPKGWTAIIDYAHTPDAVDNVIQTINEIRKGKLFTVVGCGGNRDKGKRPMMAQIAKHGSDQLILTSDNPRDEEPDDILRDMAAGLTDEELRSTLIISDRESAIKTACTLAQANDVILVAGKGHEDYQIIKGVKHHFDDHEIVRKCI